MALDLRDCTFFGPALPEPFVKFQLEGELLRRKLLPKTTGDEGRAIEERWEVYRRKLRALGEQGGGQRVAGHVLEPLAERLGYERVERQAEVITREGPEEGGWLFTAGDGRALRAWSAGLGTDLDAPSRRGRAYRFSPSRVAQRVLLAKGERAGLLTDGEELRLLLCDPARPDSHISVRLDRSGGWRAARAVPDSYCLLLALASPAGVTALPDLTEAARLAQSTVTKKLRLQARRAIEGFLQEVLDHPENGAAPVEYPDRAELARVLWREGLILVYRLLFVFKLESSADPARAFSFAATSLWRNTYSPNTALAPIVRKVLDQGADSGGYLESGLRILWRMFAGGMSSSELEVKALGGMLFGEGTTPLLDRLRWGERSVARLLDALLWTPGDGRTERERVHYGALDVEDLGSVYEALLELEPGITTEPMCRLRRAKLEVVVPVAQGDPYRSVAPIADVNDNGGDEEDGDEDGEESGNETPSSRGGKTKVLFKEEIPAGRFFLRVGLGRKSTGSYYTPHPFVRFLVQETLGPQLAERSPKENPHPGKILELKVLDPAMGSGHFLVEACRYLGEALYEACRLCDELAVQAEEQAGKASNPEREQLLARSAEMRKRVEVLPDPENELVAYLPSRVPEGEESGLSQKKAEAMCRRLVAVHCLYGVDKNPLAVELAKLSLWLESYAEGLPLTFMDHRLVCGDSLTGPFFEQMLIFPRNGAKLDDLFAMGLTKRLRATLATALEHVRDLEASVGKDVADLEQKRAAKEKLDAALEPLKLLAAAWSGGVMLGEKCDDEGYQALAEAVTKGDDTTEILAALPMLQYMAEIGKEGVAFELTFPEAFYPNGGERHGFDAVLGNPPWDKLRVERRDLLAAVDSRFLEGKEAAGSGTEHKILEALFREHADLSEIEHSIARSKCAIFRLTRARIRGVSGDPDLYQLFIYRVFDFLRLGGILGFVVGGGFAKNPADSSVRLHLFGDCQVHWFAHYVNLRQLFLGASSRVSFVVFSASKLVPSEIPARIAFELLTFEDLVIDTRRQEMFSSLRADEIFGRLQNGLHLETLVSEARGGLIFSTGTNIVAALTGLGIEMGNDLHRTSGKVALHSIQEVLPNARDARFPMELRAIVNLGFACSYDGRCFTNYDAYPTIKAGKWQPQVLLVGDLRHEKLRQVRSRTRYYRLAWRSTCGHPATNPRSARAVILPPGSIAANSVLLEVRPQKRPNYAALLACSIINSFSLDYQVRPKIQSHLNKSVMALADWPLMLETQGVRFCVHQCLRLVAVTENESPLWIEQLGNEWREPQSRHTWPVLEGEDTRWAVRAAIDAVVADAYSLNREQYAHVLSTFSHRSYPKAPELCLAALDDLKAIGLEAFTRKHDPYWDIPLNESLPKPVIDLPIQAGAEPAQRKFGPLFGRTGSSPNQKPENGTTQVPPSHTRPCMTDGPYEIILALLNEHGMIASVDAQVATGLDASAVRPLLKRLVDEGHAVTEGQKRGMKYRRAPHA